MTEHDDDMLDEHKIPFTAHLEELRTRLVRRVSLFPGNL